MKDSVWKRISAKRPRGARLFKALAIFSGIVWAAAIGAFFALGAGSGPESEAHAHSVTADPKAGVTSDSAPGAVAGDFHVHGHEGGPDHGKGPHAESHSAEFPVDIPPTREELAAWRELAELHAASGEVDKAVTPLRRIMRVPTRDADLLSLAARVFLGAGHYREALHAAGQLLEIEPGNARARDQAVQARYRLGQVDKAIAAAKDALEKSPGDLAMLVTLATMEVERGPGYADYGKALRAALKLKPDHVPSLYLQGRKAQLEGDYKDAEKAFRKVLKLEPGHAKARGQLGIAMYHLGREREAEKEYRAALDLNPADYNTWFNLGEARLSRASGELDPKIIRALRAEAMECYLKALERNGDHAQARYRVGVLLNGNGQYKEAIGQLSEALKLDSRHVPTLIQIALAYEQLKHPERARAYLDKAFELDPMNKIVLFKLRQWS